MGECDAGACVTVEDDDGVRALGVRDHAFGTNGGHVPACLVIARHPGGGGAVGYETTILAFQRDIVPLDGAVAKVQRCYQQYDETRGRDHTRLVLLMSPTAFASEAPARGHVVIPFEGTQTRLDDGAVAGAELERGPAGREIPGSLCIRRSSPGVAEDLLCNLRPGDIFAWGAHHAEIVRVVPHDRPLVGWVEVALK
jgi:hypothetical protein